jgi:xanthine/uracil permease
LTSYFPWILGGVGLLVFGMVAMGGGSARRYGR